MPDDVGVDAATSADPSSAAATTTDPSAGTKNTDTNGQPADANVPFHQHPRWQEVMRELKELRPLRGAYGQLQQELQALKTAGQPLNGQARDPERVAAIKALRSLFEEDPELKELLNATKHGEEITLLKGALGQYMQREQQGWVRTGREAISAFATANKLSEAAGKRLEGAVLGQIVAEPELLQRARSGDMTAVVKELLDGLDNDVFKTLRRADTAALVENKIAASKLPPALRAGSHAGPTAPPKVTAANEQEVRAGMREQLRAMLLGGAEG